MTTLATEEIPAQTAKLASSAEPMLVRSAAVLGAGTMGSRIAAHLANCGIPVLLLDIVPEGEKSRNKLRRRLSRGCLRPGPRLPFMSRAFRALLLQATSRTICRNLPGATGSWRQLLKSGDQAGAPDSRAAAHWPTGYPDYQLPQACRLP